MKVTRAEVGAALAPGLLLGGVLVGAAAMLAATLEAAERSALWALLEPRLALVLMLWLAASAGAGVALHRAWLRFGAAPARLAEEVQVLVSTEAAPRLRSEESAGGRALAAAVNALAQQRDALRRDLADRVAQASREVEQERNRLAALMAELTQSVVVCNLDGRILLYNARAKRQFRALAEGSAIGGGSQKGTAIGGGTHKGTAIGGGTHKGTAIGGAGALGLGRSIYAVLDRRLVAHALEAVQQRLQRGEASPSAQFVTGTHSGQLLRVQMSPVCGSASASAVAGAPDAAPDAPLNGFVLMLDDITRDLAEDAGRDQLLHTLTEGQRGALGNLQAAVELLDDPALDAPTRERFLAVIRDEIGAMSRRLNEASAQGLRALKTRWPLEDMHGADFVAAAARRIEAQVGGRVSPAEIDSHVWLRVDSYSLIQALAHLVGRLAGEYEVQRVQLRLAVAGERAQLDLVWAVQAMSTETVTAWETEPLKAGADGGESSPLTVRDVVERHGGALWFERARARQEAFFRFLLPLAEEAAPLEPAAMVRHDSRPEFYDFDLFAQGGQTGTQADRSLVDLTYTVFDTETTGLEPSAGDEIIQIGATRIVAAKLRRQECFDQLVDPQRPLSAAGFAIHGIAPEALRGQPLIARVLPAFHAFAQDTVLVAHNAAFDMRFLQLKEATSGVRFEQPVLDTLLLSAVIHPQQEAHRLEAIAERLGVPMLGRHTALGDAMVTAEVFLKMLPLLHAMGITTLAQALEASKQTYLARVTY
ncbi:MAG: exonuclease domain-containing protein [Rubrivivax sp.]|nr:exonuclease domain-containing protein [Rubrivivax sp.]